jgi:uncharacterized repeat protein (TIGR03803 family)
LRFRRGSPGQCRDGSAPVAGLVQAANGDFYGTTGGGTFGYGTIFRVTPNGMLTTLYSFGSQSGDGAGTNVLINALIQATDGNFYGTTTPLGFESCAATQCGTVFKITPTGAWHGITVPLRGAAAREIIQTR